MSLRFVIGRCGTGKTKYCMDEIAKKQLDGKNNLILIVPEQFSSQAEWDLIQSTKQKGILNARVLSFGRLAHCVFSEQGIGEKQPLSDTAKSMILRKILLDQEEKLEYYQNAVFKQGFLEQLSATINELFQYDVSLEQVCAFSEEENLSVTVKKKSQDLYLIYDQYLQFLKREYISSDEILDILAAKLENSRIIKNAEIWIDGFYGFTPQEIKVLFRLFVCTKRVTVTLTMDEYSFFAKNLSMTSLFFEPYFTLCRLKQIAQENGVKIEEPLILKETKRYGPKALSCLEQYFFSHSVKQCQNSEGIKIYAASNQYQEVQHMADCIIQLVRDENYRYKDIGIVMKDLTVYENILRGVFEEYNIPCFIDTKKEILSHTLIELARSIIAVVAHNFNYESIFRYLKTGLTGISREDVDRLENYVLAYGIKGYKWNHNDWAYGFGPEQEDEKIYMNQLKKQVESQFAPFYGSVKGTKSYRVRFISENLFQMILSLPVREYMEQWIAAMEEKNYFIKARQQQQTWNLFVEVIERLTAILGDEIVTIEEYAQILDAGFHESRLGVIPPSIDQIIIGDLERSRMPEIKALFILNVNEGVLPLPSDGNGIYSELEREELEKYGIQMAPSGKRKAFEEQYLIYLGITKPSEKLFLSYCASSLEGRAMRPSMIIGKLKKLFPDMIEEYEKPGEENNIEKINGPWPVFHKMGQIMREFVDTGNIDPLWMDIADFYASQPVWMEQLSVLWRYLTEQGEKDSLKKETVKKLYGQGLCQSVSRLEKYAACPFAYFVQYSLKAEERKLYQLNPLDLGTVFHKVLELFSTTLEKEKIDWKSLNRKQTETLVDQVVEAAAPKIGNEIFLETASNQYMIKRLKRISKRAAWTLTEHLKSGAFQPFGYEMGFGENNKLPSIVIELSDGQKMIMAGKIDRVDILDKEGKRYVKIIDYKSGMKEFSLQDIYYGLQLQLILYLDAFLKYGNAEGLSLKPGGVFYFRIKDPVIKSLKEMSQKELEELLFKELRMSGLVLDEKEVIQGMDCVFEGEGDKLSGGSSKIISVTVNKDGSYRKGSADVANEAAYETLMAFAREKAKQLGDAILQGEIGAAPYKKKEQSPCMFCSYRSICRFDEKEEYDYRYLKELKQDEFWDKIRE